MALVTHAHNIAEKIEQTPSWWRLLDLIVGNRDTATHTKDVARSSGRQPYDHHAWRFMIVHVVSYIL